MGTEPAVEPATAAVVAAVGVVREAATVANYHQWPPLEYVSIKLDLTGHDLQ